MALKAGRVGVYPEDLDKEGHIKQNETDPYVLPIATPTVLGGVKPVAKTESMTQDVGVDNEGKLYAAGGSAVGKIYKKSYTMQNVPGQDNYVMCTGINISGYTAISADVQHNGTRCFGGVNTLSNNGSVFAWVEGSWRPTAVVYYVKNEDIETLS